MTPTTCWGPLLATCEGAMRQYAARHRRVRCTQGPVPLSAAHWLTQNSTCPSTPPGGVCHTVTQHPRYREQSHAHHLLRRLLAPCTVSQHLCNK
jgi:hypothetical protein